MNIKSIEIFIPSKLANTNQLNKLHLAPGSFPIVFKYREICVLTKHSHHNMTKEHFSQYFDLHRLYSRTPRGEFDYCERLKSVQVSKFSLTLKT